MKAKLVRETLNEGLFSKKNPLDQKTPPRMADKPPVAGRFTNAIGKQIAKRVFKMDDEDWDDFKDDHGMNNMSQEDWDDFKDENGGNMSQEDWDEFREEELEREAEEKEEAIQDKADQKEYRKEVMSDAWGNMKDSIFAKRDQRRHQESRAKDKNNKIELAHRLLEDPTIGDLVNILANVPYEGTPDMYLAGKFGKGPSYIKKTKKKEYNAMQRERKVAIKDLKNALDTAIDKKDMMHYNDIYDILTRKEK